MIRVAPSPAIQGRISHTNWTKSGPPEKRLQVVAARYLTFTVDVDAPAAPRDDAVNGRHAEPRSFADLLRGRERLEQVRLH
jgi:hypothetical protein